MRQADRLAPYCLMALPPAWKEVLVAGILADVPPAGALAMTAGPAGRRGRLVVLLDRPARTPAATPATSACAQVRRGAAGPGWPTAQ